MCGRVSQEATQSTFVRIAAGGAKFAVTIILIEAYAMVHCWSGAFGGWGYWGSWGPIADMWLLWW